MNNSINLKYIDLVKKSVSASLYEESTWKKLDVTSSKSQSPFAYIRKTIRNRFIKFAAKNSVYLVKADPRKVNQSQKGGFWPLFGYSMAGLPRLNNTQWCMEQAIMGNVPGDFIETGAWRGGMVILMRAVLEAYNVKDRKVWVADSFEGMPKPKNSSDGWDLSSISYLNVSLEDVKQNFEKFGLLDEQVHFLKGWFCDTLPYAPIEKIAVLRLDGDLYSSTMDALKSLYHKVSNGGFVIVDDYNSWPACRAAVSDFLHDIGESPVIEKIDEEAVFWKVNR